MAIAYDNSNSYFNTTPATSFTVSYTTGSGSDRFLVVSLITNVAAPNQDNVISVTYAGVSMTSVAEYQTTNQNVRHYYYVLHAPATGANNIVLTTTASDALFLQAASYTGVNQASSVDSSNTGTATGNLTLSTTVVASDCWLHSMARNSNVGPMTAGTGTTDRSSGTRAHSSGDSNGTVGTGSQSMAWTAASGSSFGQIISFAPAVAATSSIKTFNGLAYASTKTVNGLAIASVKTWNGLA